MLDSSVLEYSFPTDCSPGQSCSRQRNLSEQQKNYELNDIVSSMTESNKGLRQNTSEGLTYSEWEGDGV